MEKNRPIGRQGIKRNLVQAMEMIDLSHLQCGKYLLTGQPLAQPLEIRWQQAT